MTRRWQHPGCLAGIRSPLTSAEIDRFSKNLWLPATQRRLWLRVFRDKKSHATRTESYIKLADNNSFFSFLRFFSPSRLEFLYSRGRITPSKAEQAVLCCVVKDGLSQVANFIPGSQAISLHFPNDQKRFRLNTFPHTIPDTAERTTRRSIMRVEVVESTVSIQGTFSSDAGEETISRMAPDISGVHPHKWPLPRLRLPRVCGAATRQFFP